MTADVLMLENVSKSYRTVGKWQYGHHHEVLAVRNVSLCVQYGEIYGLIGESGSGKSTLARLIVALEQPTSGSVLIDGVNIAEMKPIAVRSMRREMQIVFQDPYSALDPSQTVEAAIEEPLLNLTADSKARRMQRILELLHEVGLPERLARAYPHQLSGGERQRVCIARALAPHPRLLVCDEPVSALDKSIQAQILNLLRDLQRDQGLAYLFISHDLAVINHLCTRVAVMLRGRIVEEGDRLQVLLHGAHPYTRCLIEAAAYFAGNGVLPRLTPSASKAPENGCIFHDRCLHAQARCRRETPSLRELMPGHRVACHFPLSDVRDGSS
ncbi:peptide/nickel transport system ATP-binding protein [Nitrosospira sp. Nl5]|uniref:oligopeptide/dipeptide ABC transporter ATP-binding protein n=1 Tax=Nitrosospira sp. Nl5 TaxID=200120 RepID=UPI000889157B|nr:oligopeptide/dipeptide ABC transporter ATP-binding protein [Nitrosospira sp. Nl5]SCY03524.1 peptide/nickel transport system ATP-binding protein [Nitrosospira sp. Nl5]